jgi:endoglucanase
MRRELTNSPLARLTNRPMELRVLAGSFAVIVGACASPQTISTGSSASAGSAKNAADLGGATAQSAERSPTSTSKVTRHAPGENPFVNAKWWEDPYSQAHLRALRAKSKGETETAELLSKLAKNGGADWIGEWTPYVERWIDKRITLLNKSGAQPYFVAYNIPKRDCGQYSAGGASKAQDYKNWIVSFARGIGDRKAVVILEPDALPLLKKCLSEADQKERIELIRFAVHSFAQLPLTWVYVDAGHPGWIPAAEMAERLKTAGITEADGFSLNVSNYKPTDAVMAYGKQLSALVGNKHFVIDTSRNGNGAPDADADSEAAWCNPDGRAAGSPPTAQTSEPLCDAFLWIKKPGESDGTCNGGPKAGEWWQQRALELAKGAKW